MLPFNCSINLGQLSPVYIFRNISATLPSGVKYDFLPRLGLRLLLVSPKFSAISRSGSSFFILPNSLFSKVDL